MGGGGREGKRRKGVMGVPWHPFKVTQYIRVKEEGEGGDAPLASLQRGREGKRGEETKRR